MLGWTHCPREVSSGLTGGFNIKLKMKFLFGTGGLPRGPPEDPLLWKRCITQ